MRRGSALAVAERSFPASSTRRTVGVMVDAFLRGTAVLSRVTGIASAGLLVLSVAVICQMLFVRFVLNQATIWQSDFVTYSLIAATFIGSPYVLLTRGHVNVDVLPHYLPDGARYWLALIAAGLSLAFCALFTVLSYGFFYQAWTEHWLSDSIWRVRLWIPYSSMPIGTGILSLQYIADIVSLVTGRAPPFGIKHGGRG
jgi:TRAP-type C4-dicarboxylate transport system permease small subunit